MEEIILRRSLVFGIIIILFLGASVIPSVGGNIVVKQENKKQDIGLNPGGNVLYVGGDGPRNYTKIQNAIDDSIAGDTVYVYSGIYYETVFLNKQIDLIGEDRETTIIDGSGNTWWVVRVYTDYAKISGFSIKNSMSEGAGVIAFTSNIIIHDNIIFNCFHGVETQGISHITISKNFITNNIENGIYMMSTSDNIIIGNTITSNNNKGIFIGGSSDNTISENSIQDNIGIGIDITDSSQNTISGNIIINNKEGVHLTYYSCSNTILDNVISHNKQYGVKISSSSSDNIIIKNRITCNDREGVYVMSEDSLYNYVYHNLFLSHMYNAYCNGYTYWYSNELKEGNYWDDYTGVDENPEDGIGDTPYQIRGGNNDKFPVMEPWSDNEPPETPTIDGPRTGKIEVEYDYQFFTTDPEGELIEYYIHWGDEAGWFGPYDSGETVIITHTWLRVGDYTIKVKARDFYGLETDWVTLSVSMPKDRFITDTLFMRLLEQFLNALLILRNLLRV